MHDPFSIYTFPQLLEIFLPRVLVATFCGGLVGLDREVKSKVAGVKTNILICVGTTIFTVISVLLGGPGSDPTRIMAQVVSGISFLGAGAIFKGGDRVTGMTTASFIWVNASLGMLIGCGGLGVACVLTLGLLLVTRLVAFFERRYLRNNPQDYERPRY